MSIRDRAPAAGRMAAFALVLALLIWTTLRIGVAIHESSHLLVSGLFGASLKGIKVPAFGDGYGNFSFAPAVGRLPRFLSLAVGPVSQVVGGLTALALSRRVVRRRWLELFLVVYGAANLLFGLQYAASGLYSAYGDPGFALIVLLPPCEPNALNLLTWTLVVVIESAILVSSYVLARRYLAVQDRWFPVATVGARLRVATLTAVPAVVTFVAVFVLASLGTPNFFFGSDPRWNVPARDYRIAALMSADGATGSTPAAACQRAVDSYVNQLIGDREQIHSSTVEQLQAQGVRPPPTGRVPLLAVSAGLVTVGAGAALLRTRRRRTRDDERDLRVGVRHD